MYNENNTLLKIKLIRSLELLEIKRICDKHNVKYTLLFSTLLGIVRHQRFIPLNDDIDMKRGELNKYIVTCNIDLYCSSHNTQFKMKGIHLVNPRDGCMGGDTVVDIYPIDASSNRYLQRKLHTLFSAWFLIHIYTGE